MSNSKFELIERHRKQLIGRLLARNPLLHFKPSDKGNRKIDICGLFAQDVQDNNLVENQHRQVNIFEKLITHNKVSITLSDSTIIRRTTRMKEEAYNLQHAIGLPSLFWAWPLVRVPRPREGGNPLVAPLLFWQIKVKVHGHNLSIRMSDKIPVHNFILQSWLKEKRGLELPLSSIVKGQDDELNMVSIVRQINKIANKWDKCESMLKEGEPYQLCKYSGDSDKLEILPCAVLGIANFKYGKLLSDLEKLANEVKHGNNCGLLDEFLGSPSSGGLDSSTVNTPCELEKYMVEESDASQECAVWKSRESKIMLLEGPPGTGKSQTIVNLIADALKRKESVALICHKPAALDVVKKRLDAAELKNLTIKITNPRTDNRPIIRQIRKIKDYNDEVANDATDEDRSQCIDEINRLEEDCERILESRGSNPNNAPKYSIRGHLRGKMENIKENIKFDPYHYTHKSFVKGIADIVKNSLDNENERKQVKDKLAKFTDGYTKCNFDKNLWREARHNSAQKFDFLERFKSLVSLADEIGKGYNKLPNERLMPFLANKIMRKYAHELFHEKKKDIVKEILLLIKSTMDIFAEVGISPPPLIWEAVYQGGDCSKYQSCYDDAQHLDTVIYINKQRQIDKIIKEFMSYQKNIRPAMSHWPDVLETIFCILMLSKIPHCDISVIDKEKQRRDDLGKKIKEKRGLDAGVICRGFSNRSELAGELYRDGLLRLRRVENRRASTIRDICHKKMKEFHGIHPVLLMNPDAMCQILPLQPEIIDLAIVDEASQMFVADALPILYRAKKIVVSGDDMQMPPDDAFSLRGDNDSDDDDEREEFDSTPPAAAENYELMEATKLLLANNKANCALNVHYRSRPAELIAFSNHAFYNGKLQVAIDNGILPEPLERPIQVIHAAGTFEKGANNKERTEIIKCLETIWNTDNPPSVGVIMFNLKQAQLLRDELSEKCKSSSEFREKYEKAEGQKDGEEDVGFFARSVEHVQGDERDIIILATTYNNSGGYGPLTIGEKGRRRLNVAVTRAKHGMLVITSFDINNIANEGQRPEGSHAGGNNGGSEKWYVWKFMMYARAVSEGNREAAAKILQSINGNYDPRPVGQEAESQFEKDVGDFIQKIGYAVDYQVGEGGFRIDLGIKQRKEDKQYICGIECDGRYWHEGWRARHNDVWRQDILENKGWKIYRIWSDYWYMWPDQTRKNLSDYFKKIAGSG